MTALRTESDRTRFVAFLNAQALPLGVTCEPWKEPRTSQQNRYLFGVCYPPIAQVKGYTVDEIHEWMCGAHWGWVDKPCPKTPRNPEGIESVPFRSTTRDENGKRDVLKKKPFSEFVETVHRLAAQGGIFIAEAWVE